MGYCFRKTLKKRPRLISAKCQIWAPWSSLVDYWSISTLFLLQIVPLAMYGQVCMWTAVWIIPKKHCRTKWTCRKHFLSLISEAVHHMFRFTMRLMRDPNQKIAHASQPILSQLGYLSSLQSEWLWTPEVVSDHTSQHIYALQIESRLPRVWA